MGDAGGYGRIFRMRGASQEQEQDRIRNRHRNRHRNMRNTGGKGEKIKSAPWGTPEAMGGFFG